MLIATLKELASEKTPSQRYSLLGWCPQSETVGYLGWSCRFLMIATPRCIRSPLPDGALATQAIVLIDQLIDRQRAKVAQWEEFTRIGLFLDEIDQHADSAAAAHPAELRGLGCAICFAAQAGSQLDAVYGPLQGKAIRDVTQHLRSRWRRSTRWAKL